MTERICVLTEDPDGPSARHRWSYAAPWLLREGFVVELRPVQPRAARPEAFAAASAADVVVIHRKLFTAADHRRLRRLAGNRLVYDLDDAVMVRPSGRRRQRSVLRSLKFSRTLRQSRLFVAGNPTLAGYAPRLLPVIVRPTPVEPSRHPVRSSWPARGRAVGWIGTAATLPYLEVARPALAELSARRDDFVLRVIGPPPGELPGVRMEHVSWSEATEGAELARLDVGILPLPDDPWTRGKCAFKALQCMAAGLPVVASPVGMNRDVVEDGVTGLLAATTEDWVEGLSRLLDDAGLRESCGRAGRVRIEERYAHEVLAPKLARSIRSALR